MTKRRADFEDATSFNLPLIDYEMIDEFYRRNSDFLSVGVQNMKAER